jgi:sugar phosphate isomerase/epimerase
MHSPTLKHYLNLVTIQNLRPGSIWPGLEGRDAVAWLKEQGFDGVQTWDRELQKQSLDVGLECAGDGHVYEPGDATAIAERGAGEGLTCATVFVGYGIEDDAEIDRLLHELTDAVERFRFPLYVETHRATATQDLWRTVQIARRHPAIRFNVDFSHYYTGLEMTRNGRLADKLDFLAPVLERTRFMHGRIGSPGCIQVDIGDGKSPIPQEHGVDGFLADWREMWTRAMTGFLKTAAPGDSLPFAPEILDGSYYYARQFPDPTRKMTEESDRYQQALVHRRIATECFEAAKKRITN